MSEKQSVPFLVCAGIAVALGAAHFLGHGPSSVIPEEKPAAKRPLPVPKGPSSEEKREAFRANFQPTMLDNPEDRDQKQLNQTMRALNSTPVEIVSHAEIPGAPGIVLLNSPEDVARMLAEGGTYTGDPDPLAPPAAPEAPAAKENKR